jgi:hypothetical protein
VCVSFIPLTIASKVGRFRVLDASGGYLAGVIRQDVIPAGTIVDSGKDERHSMPDFPVQSPLFGVPWEDGSHRSFAKIQSLQRTPLVQLRKHRLPGLSQMWIFHDDGGLSVPSYVQEAKERHVLLSVKSQ